MGLCKMRAYMPTEEQRKTAREEIDKMTPEERDNLFWSTLRLASKGLEIRRKDGHLRANGVIMDEFLEDWS